MADEKQSLVFKYIFDDTYNPKYVNGAYGGINPKGEIVINFYFERSALPTKQTFYVQDGRLLKENIAERTPDDHAQSFIRFVENGVIFDLDNAKVFQNWLQGKIDQLEKNKKDE